MKSTLRAFTSFSA